MKAVDAVEVAVKANWMNTVEESGARALRARKRGPKEGARLLEPHQAAALVRRDARR